MSPCVDDVSLSSRFDERQPNDMQFSLLTKTLSRLLVRHDEAFLRLRDEVEAVMGAETQVTKAKLQSMTYLKCVVTESRRTTLVDACSMVHIAKEVLLALRLYPPVPVNFREANHPTILPRGGGPDGLSPVLVRKNMGIGYAPYHMHRRRDLYGEDSFR